MNNEPLPIGTLLLPNSYQIQRGDPISGLILQVHIDRKWKTTNYTVHLSNGITRRIGSDVIHDLFQVVKTSTST